MKTPAERFQAKVDKNGPVHPGLGTACWVWTASKNRGGYGTFMFGGKVRKAHRVAFWIATGTEPGQLCVLHHCDNPSCVNPGHLWLGTGDDNVADRHRKGRSGGARGSRNGAHTKPESRRCGDRNWTRQRPELVLRGERNARATLNDAKVRMIRALRASGVSLRGIAARVGVSDGAVCHVLAGRTWRHVA